MLLALFVIWQYDPQGRKLDGDASFMLYAGQQILRGNAPYKTVGIVKLPFSPFVAATGIAVGRAFGIEDALAGRYIFILCALLAVGATFLVGAQLGGNLLGVLSAVALIGFQTLSIHAAKGPEAKMPMIAAGMVCVWLLAKRKWFAGGLAGALAFLTWQPGLIFVACALLAPILETRAQRTRAFLLSSGGVALPLALVGIYFAAHDALQPMFAMTFGANNNYFQNKKVAAGLTNVIVSNAQRLWMVTNKCTVTEPALLYLGWLGMLGGSAFLAWRVGKTFFAKKNAAETIQRNSWLEKNRALLLNTLPLFISGAALVGFSLIDVQSCMDFVPLMPFFALGVGIVLAFAVEKISAGIARTSPLPHARVLFILGALVSIAVLGYGIQDALKQKPQNGLAKQHKLVRKLTAALAPDDRVQQFGDATLFVMSGRQNATHFMHLGEKQGNGILAAEGVTMEKLVVLLEEANPRMLILSRARTKGWADVLFQWIETNYELRDTYRKADGGTRGRTDVWWRKSN